MIDHRSELVLVGWAVAAALLGALYLLQAKTKDATAVVHLSVGPDIDVWRAKGGVVEVSYYDPRSPAQRTEYERLRARVKDDLRALTFVDAKRGWAVGENSTVLRTRDGGKTWRTTLLSPARDTASRATATRVRPQNEVISRETCR